MNSSSKSILNNHIYSLRAVLLLKVNLETANFGARNLQDSVSKATYGSAFLA